MKNYLIIGASSDIGLAYIRHLEEICSDEDDVTVIAHYNTMSPKFKMLTDSVKKISIHAVKGDLSEPDDTKRVISQTKNLIGNPTHILHLPAGKFHHMRIKQFDTKKTLQELNIQLFSLGETLKEFLPAMAKEGTGRVVVMLTAYTLGIPPKYVTDYIICKYALLGLVRAAASEYGDKGVTINGISPTMIESKFICDLDERIVESLAKEAPLGRNITIDEVVGAIDYLMSDFSSYVNGTNLNITGGGVLI
ncbi:MAG: SDR family oxidoreductase [Clostridiales Family XIII bacterium]|jgi:3-oxoacyl-[acyl-carrier protein] reductase|nr:SDR family oxidoreductase [Clostridiales Family XIII bacterium]